MSSGFTRPCTTWIAPSLPTVTMQPEMAMSSGLKTARALNGVLDLREARLDRLRLLDQLVGPLVLVHVDELVVADVQPLDLGLLVVRGLGRRGMHPPEAREVGPVDVEAGLGPLPAGRQLVRRNLEPVEGELHQKRRVFQPDAVLVLVGEEVAQDGTAGRLVGVPRRRSGRARRLPECGPPSACA